MRPYTPQRCAGARERGVFVAAHVDQAAFGVESHVVFENGGIVTLRKVVYSQYAISEIAEYVMTRVKCDTHGVEPWSVFLPAKSELCGNIPQVPFCQMAFKVC
jgi:hypothetical protein